MDEQQHICRCGKSTVSGWGACKRCLLKSDDYIVMETCLWTLHGGVVTQLPPEIAPGRNGAESIHFGYEYLTDYYFYWCHLLYESVPGEEKEEIPEPPDTSHPTHGTKRYRPENSKAILESDFDWEYW